MSNLKLIKIVSVLGTTSILALGALGLPSAHAADNATTTANLTVNTGALTMYAGDAVANNDLCVGTNGSANFLQDNGSSLAVTCTTAENSVNFDPLAVKSTRDSTSVTTINDILFEDLSGSTANTYSVAVTLGNLVNGTNSGEDVVLGSNPDAVATAESGDAPSGANAGKLYCVFDPSVGGTQGIAPGAAASQTLSKGTKATVISTLASNNVFNTASASVVPGRYDLDGATLQCRVPAFVTAGSYTQAITFTVTAS